MLTMTATTLSVSDAVFERSLPFAGHIGLKRPRSWSAATPCRSPASNTVATPPTAEPHMAKHPRLHFFPVLTLYIHLQRLQPTTIRINVSGVYDRLGNLKEICRLLQRTFTRANPCNSILLGVQYMKPTDA